MIHERPRCFTGDGVVSHDPVFAAPCDHAECPSVVWHPLCLMGFRENRDQRRADMARFLERHEVIVQIREKESE